ncbi:hypothetical protein GCM10007301_03710 [Azorhizobium oxalatiphilum]|uniref:Flagellar hook-length control protein-like C-terminal domain-containing protein n=1 Tax=Azorhizobium oxalatiphilum TaxID=980631 RepID=A0A917F3U6_9HYPH|nr:flagellar hook-length control protein FliK [Azorhizobium oxalatiphilum]GGF47633.1 hypothetical protein GCM10007301_03710 [Azorhizobium oxalatiphilum]
MSAINVTAALPTTRASESSSSAKSADSDSGFNDVFKDLSQSKKDSGQAASTSGSDQPADTANTAQPAKSESAQRSLADTLAELARQRTETSEDGAGSDGKSDEEAAAADKQADTDATKDLTEEKRLKQARDRAATNRQMESQAVSRRMEGLTALLFGREGGETGVGAGGDIAEDVSLTGDGLKAALAEKAEGQQSADAQAGAAANPVINLATLLPAKEDAGSVQEEGGEQAAAATQLVAAEDDSAATGAKRDLQINVLSRETHFAPIRTLGLNGGSAPAEEAQTDATAFSLAAETAKTGRAATGRTATESQPWTVSQTGVRSATTATATAQASADTEALAAEAAAGEIDTPRTVARAATTDGRSRENTNRERSDTGAGLHTTQTTREAARTDVSQGVSANATAARQESEAAAMPVTGTAGIAHGGVATQNLPTLQQIGSAIAAEANTMGQQGAPVAGANTASTEALAGPVRLLQIQLKPDDLGTVNVRMRLSGNGLEIQLRASNPETARLLERDRDALSALLSASGISADSITIVGIDSGGSMQLTGQDAGRPFAQPEASAQQADGQDQNFSDQQGRGQQDENEQNGARNDQASSRSSAADAGSDFRDFRI